MTLHPLAGKPATRSILVNVPRLVTHYYTRHPDVSLAAQQVSFGTSGHRGTSFKNSFNEDHILATSQAICDYRRANDITGPLFLGMDTHALSEPAHASAIEVFAANGVEIRFARQGEYTPTPVISHAILVANRGRNTGLADGVVITPSHNPPEDGGFKYNPPHGGPADSDVTRWIEQRANKLLRGDNQGVRRIPLEKALRQDHVREYDYIAPYVSELASVIDFQAIRDSDVKIGVDPMGGAAVAFWEPIAQQYGLKLEVVNPVVDPTFGFMTVDKDGKIRMDCSSPYAMASLIGLKDHFDIAFGNDADCDRHGIVTRSLGLMNPNHYLAVAIWYLFQNRAGWRRDAKIGKTLVSSSMIDRVAAHLGKGVAEVPVGFKWFVGGLLDGSYGFAGEESAGASFLRKDGTVWTTDKDGVILDLLAVEITAKTGKDPGEHYQHLVRMFGDPCYERLDVAASAERRTLLGNLTPAQVTTDDLAGEPILAKLTHAPGNGAPIGGLKVITKNGWFAARPSGTEDIYKIYVESFKGPDHLRQIREEAEHLINDVFRSAGLA
ncbi:MAG TPA: phosphoglucomutase, alpha-D-glucose phosphate-specific [Syntrophobacteraceae bacterium]|nr:phosphoglucomutase, alpha-D-glucose phosphate-specific [Syntrophobacteraceae bacterium]